MRTTFLLLSCSLVLAACGASPTRSTLAGAQSYDRATTLTVSVAPEVKLVTVELSGDKLGSPRVFQATAQGGRAVVALTGVPSGKYQAAVRAYDAPDKAVVLYKASAVLSTSGSKTLTGPALNRVTANVNVTASPALAKSARLIATLGTATQQMNVAGGQATATFSGVPTARGLTVKVQGATEDGQVSQRGAAVFNLSEGGARPAVALTELATCPVPAGSLTTIEAVQGEGATSPLVGQTVTVRGVVSGNFQSGLSGFYLQDPAGDGNPRTSDGVFVFTGQASQNVASGDLVQFSAAVKEFSGETQLDTLTGFVKCGAAEAVKPTELRFPLNDAASLEAYEGMLVTIPTELTVTDTFGLGRYGELGLSSGGRVFNPTNGQGGSAAENAPRRVTLDDGLSVQNPAVIPYLSGEGTGATRRAGDTVRDLTGTLRYGNGAYKIEPTAAPQFTAANPRPLAPADVGGTLRVAGANVLNFFTDFGGSNRGANSAYEFERQKAKVVASLQGLDADIVTLMEIQNNGDTALNTLVTALNDAYGAPTYRAVTTGVVGTDAIKVAIIYKPGRVTPVGAPVIDDNTDSVYSRPPVAQTFQDLGSGVLTVVANHLKSKGSCPASATDPNADSGQGCWNALRVQQAQKLLAFTARLRQQSGDDDVLLMGDFNAYGDEDPIKTITAGGFVSENKRVPLAERYSYGFGGQFGYLDHALASASLDGQVSGITEWHINSDEPTVFDYNVEFKNNPSCASSTCTSPDLYAPTPFRASDHDPVLIGLNLQRDADPAPAPLTLSLSGASEAAVGEAYPLSITPSRQPDSLSVDWGDGSPQQALDPGASGASHTYTSAGPVTIQVTAGVAGSAPVTASQALTLRAPATPGSSALRVSQVYGGGGNSGASYNSDFVELFNAGPGALSVSGASLQYASSAGVFGASNVLRLPDFNLQPGQYYLVRLASGTNGAALPLSPDGTGGLNLSATSGKLALVGNSDPVTGKDDPDVLDFVGYGAASEFEGSGAAAALSATTSASRAQGGCTDSNDNRADFSVGAVQPRNGGSPQTPCS